MSGHSETVVEQSTTKGVPTAKVVVGVDGTAANWSAVSWAVAESRRVGRPLLLVASGAGTLATGSASGDDLEAESSQRLTEDLLEGVRTRLVGQGARRVDPSRNRRTEPLLVEGCGHERPARRRQAPRRPLIDRRARQHRCGRGGSVQRPGGCRSRVLGGPRAPHRAHSGRNERPR
jgi:hypothetical protein